MDIGVLTVVLGGEPLEDALDYLADLGVDAVELGCGGFVGEDHLPREEYLDDEDAQAELLELVDSRDLRISAISTHNNPLHPDDERAARADTELREAVELADVLIASDHAGVDLKADLTERLRAQARLEVPAGAVVHRREGEPPMAHEPRAARYG